MLDVASQDAVRSAAATAMGLSLSSVEYVEAIVISQTSSRVTPGVDVVRAPPENSSSMLVASGRFLRFQPTAVSYVLKAVVRTKASLSGTSFVDPVALYNSLVSLLSSSVTSGSFTSQMQSQAAASGSSQLTSASASDVDSSPLVVVTSPLVDDNSNNGGDSSTVGMIAGLVVGLVMGAMIVGCIFYWRCYRHTDKEPLSASTTQEGDAGDNTLLAPEEKKSKKGFKNFKNALFRKKKPSATAGNTKSDIKASTIHGSRHGFQALGDDHALRSSNDFFEFDVNPASPDRNKKGSNEVYEYEMNPVRTVPATVPDFYKNAARAAPAKKLSSDSMEFGLNPEGNKKGSGDFYENPTRSVPPAKKSSYDFYDNSGRTLSNKTKSTDSVEYGLNPELKKKNSGDFYENPTRSGPTKKTSREFMEYGMSSARQKKDPNDIDDDTNPARAVPKKKDSSDFFDYDVNPVSPELKKKDSDFFDFEINPASRKSKESESMKLGFDDYQVWELEDGGVGFGAESSL